MQEKDKNRSSGTLMAIVIVIVTLMAVSGFWLLKERQTGHETPEKQVKPEKIHMAVEEQAVIDYQDLQENKALKTEMDKRKTEHGVEKGLDFIVKAEESLKIGDSTIPMQEILDKIRLKRGDIIENDLAVRLDMERLLQEKTARISQLTEAESRYQALEKQLKNPAASKNQKEHEAHAREYADLTDTVADFKRYKATLTEQAKARKLLEEGDTESRAAARTTLHTLKLEIEKLERRLNIPRIPEKFSETYGIYVVRPGDNIWNIHFKFLKDYFANRRIILTPKSDEPDVSGISSGVGKILKFSEKMVYIYNLKEHKLDVDLNLLQPLSKIVIFNMGEVLALLDPIDYSKVNSIRFDGETLWIPAEQ